MNWLLVLGLFLLFLAYLLYRFKENLEKMQIGNVWLASDGMILTIVDIASPDDDYPIKCKSKGVSYSYNTLGKAEFLITSRDFHKHLGNKITNPEYFL